MAKEKQSYKEAVIEIENILELIENEELDIDELSVKVKRASTLIKTCKQKLMDTQKEVESILDQEKD